MSTPQRFRVPTRAAVVLSGIAATAAAIAPAPASADLLNAAHSARVADHRVVAAARSLGHCQTVGANCGAHRSGLQLAARRYSTSVTTLRFLGRHAGAQAPTKKLAPTLTVKGPKLEWKRVRGVESYVVVRKVPKQADVYSVVRAASTLPPAVPGKTVRYAVRTAVKGSHWSPQRSISYAALAEASDGPAVAETPVPAAQDTPPNQVVSSAKPTDATVLSSAGQTLTWNDVAGVSDYVFVRKVPGQPDAYSSVHGTSVTPPASPGKTVSYSVRTAVDGSAWATEVRLTYPAAPEPAPAGPFIAGVNAGSAHTWELPFLGKIGARTARLEFEIDTPVADLASDIENYAKAGIRPLLLAGFQGRAPTQAESARLADWAAAYGPGGTFWAGKGYPASVAPTQIEFGNETSYSWQYSQLAGDDDWPHSAFFKGIAADYARGVKAAALAIRSANPRVGLLVVGEQASGWTTWMDTMFETVPELASYVDGWTIHPYGPGWQKRMDDLIAQAAHHDAPSSIPLWVTEMGLSTDGGRCLSDNYGWDKCMSSSAAASTLNATVAAMTGRYASRLAAVYLYQAHDLRQPGASNDREGYFGALTLDGESKGAYTDAVKSFLAS